MPRTKSVNQNKETTGYSEKKRKFYELESNDKEFKTQLPKKMKIKNSELVSPVFIEKILSLGLARGGRSWHLRELEKRH